jgi:hypothetical protein
MKIKAQHVAFCIYTYQSYSSGKRTILTVNYTNNLSFDNIEMRLNVLDSSLVVLDTIYADVKKGTNTIVFNYDNYYLTNHLFLILHLQI